MISDKLLLSHLTTVSICADHSPFAFYRSSLHPSLSWFVPHEDIIMLYLGCFALWPIEMLEGRRKERLVSLFYTLSLITWAPLPKAPNPLRQPSSISAVWVAATALSEIKKWFPLCPKGEGEMETSSLLIREYLINCCSHLCNSLCLTVAPCHHFPAWTLTNFTVKNQLLSVLPLPRVLTLTRTLLLLIA